MKTDFIIETIDKKTRRFFVFFLFLFFFLHTAPLPLLYPFLRKCVMNLAVCLRRKVQKIHLSGCQDQDVEHVCVVALYGGSKRHVSIDCLALV